jgi:single-strand DNA-binding protein
MTTKKVEPTAAAGPSRNEVVLVGRLSGEVVTRELPSGDQLSSWRLVVDRPGDGPRAVAGRRSPTVDTIDCAAHRGQVRRLAAGWQVGDTLEITGALRRRFWRGPHGLGSRYEVEASGARRLARVVPSTPRSRPDPAA